MVKWLNLQQTLVRWKIALESKFFEWPGLLIFVRIQHMSSQRLNPHFFKQDLPMSRPSDDPHHKNTKLLGAAMAPIFKFITCVISIWTKSKPENLIILLIRKVTCSQDQKSKFVAPIVLWYSSSGGSTRITSNLLFKSNKLQERRSHFRYIGGVEVKATCSSCRTITYS